MWTVKDIMEYYKVTKRTVFNWIDRGMPFKKIGKCLRFEPDRVKSWADEQNKG